MKCNYIKNFFEFMFVSICRAYENFDTHLW